MYLKKVLLNEQKPVLFVWQNYGLNAFTLTENNFGFFR